MCTFLESHEMALSLGAVRKDEEMGRADLREGKKRPCFVYGLFTPQSGEYPEWRKIKKCVLLLPDERAARLSVEAHPPPLT